MNKRNYFLLIISSLVFLFLFIISCNQDSPTEPLDSEPYTVFSTGFESDSVGRLPSGWTVESGTTGDVVVNTTASEGNHSLFTTNAIISGPATMKIYKMETAKEIDIVIYFSIKIETFTGYYPNENTILCYNNIEVVKKDTKRIGIESAGSIGVDQNTWYKCKLRIDWDTSKVSLVVGDTSTDPVSFISISRKGFKQDLTLYPGGYYIDEIKVSEENVDL